ncbi:hypothetical protein [Sphaerisporangium sp. TRM90804]|uniref:hypothetical protein n=1 Tax=Sphaerisporangium sp. TRM90804 TaxID=3031113 RepID=UPI00244826A0|nr:hypothetical protein [Sphaerisporangium sp. TRM90804]MDH2430442.1 hypothetical protein [Sphaerisporangium sp. TRM90804]
MDLTADPGTHGAADPGVPDTTEASPPQSRHSAELRRFVETLLAGLAAGDTPPQPPPGALEAPDDWLAPAAEALLLLLTGQDALEPLSRAATLDETRTALFLCLGLAISGHGDRIHASWLGTAFGDLATDRPVTPGQRALWTVAARGAYGPAGKIFVMRRLDAAAAATAVEPDRWVGALLSGESPAAESPALAALPALGGVPQLAESIEAASRLSHLLERCRQITAPRRPEAAQPPSTAEEPLSVLRSLAGADEQPAASRSLTEHLLDDVRAGADPALSAIAFHVAAPALRAAAEEFAEAAQAAPPSEITVPINGHQVTLRPEGPDADSLAAAEAKIAADGASRVSGRWLAYLPAMLPIVALVLAFTVSEWFAVASLVLGGVAGYVLWRRTVREQAEAGRVEREKAELRELADGAVWALHDYARESTERAETATEHLATLGRLLRRGPAVA